MFDTSRMKYLGIDFGTKRLGIAVSDGNASIAFPRKVLENGKRTFDELAQIIEAERVDAIVVGDTRSLSGAENSITAEGDAFIAALEKNFHMPIHRVREAWSSAEAMRFAPPRQAP